MATRQPAAPVALREPPAVPVQPVASPPLPAAARVGARSVRSFGWRAGTLGASHLCHVAIGGLQLIRLILPLALCDARKAAAPNNPVWDWCSRLRGGVWWVEAARSAGTPRGPHRAL